MASSFSRAQKNFRRQMDRRIKYLNDYSRGSVSKKAMEDAVKLIKDEATELTPVDTGALLESQYSFVEVKEGEVTGGVGYNTESGAPTNSSGYPYAPFVHQIPADHSGGNNPPRAQWRFLSTAFKNKQDEVVKILNKSRGKLVSGWRKL